MSIMTHKMLRAALCGVVLMPAVAMAAASAATSAAASVVLLQLSLVLPLHSVTTVAAVSFAAPPPCHPVVLRRCLGRHCNHHRIAILC